MYDCLKKGFNSTIGISKRKVLWKEGMMDVIRKQEWDRERITVSRRNEKGVRHTGSVPM